MHERLAALKWASAIICAVALFVAPALAGSTGMPSLGSKTVGDSSEVASPAEGPTIKGSKLYPRTVAWWPYTTGPHYGNVPRDQRRDEDVLSLQVGSFKIGEGLSIPAELMSSIKPAGAGQQYFLAQARAETIDDALHQTLASMGADVVGTLTVNGLLLRLDPSAYEAVAGSSLLQYLEPYHPAYKLDPAIGHVMAITPEAAASPNFDLALTLFKGEPAAATAELAKSLGATVTGVFESALGSPAEVWLSAHAAKIPELARIESVFSIRERAPIVANSDGALWMQSPTRLVGDYSYWKAGVDGDGVLITVNDSGMSPDAGDFRHTRATAGWDPSNPSGCNVIDDHRKIRCYQNASAVGGAGDLEACDSNISGQFTHGQNVAGVALGNATRGELPVPASSDWYPNPSPTDMRFGDTSEYWNPGSIPAYGEGHWDNNQGDPDPNFSELQDTGYDGIAKGARLVFYDSSSGCPDADTPTLSPGPWSTNLTTPWAQFGSFIHNASYGSDPAPQTDPSYSAASSADQTMFSNLQFVSIRAAGNGGPRPFSGTSADPGNVGNEASCKNCFVIGSTTDEFGGVASWSAEGPASSDRLRVAPLLLTDGWDYSCRSEEDQQELQDGPFSCEEIKSTGTSFSAPNASGAAAVIAEYFRSGFYPGGSKDPNSAVDYISAPLMKSLMIAGTAGFSGPQRGIPDGRFNNVWGYGVLFLTRVLPLADFPAQTVSGLVVHDRPGDIDSDGSEDGASNLSMNPGISATPGATEEAEFEVVSADEDLAVVLSWHDDGANAEVANDLDLELYWCGPNANCEGGAPNGDDGTLYVGNAFSEFPSRNPATTYDLNDNDEPDGYNYSIPKTTVDNAGLPVTYDTWRDSHNNMEAIFLARDGVTLPEGLENLQAGTYNVTVRRQDGSTPNLHFAIAIAGPVVADSAVRLDQAPVSCNGSERIVVTEVAKDSSVDPGCYEESGTITCDPSTIADRTTVNVYDETDTLVDSETGLTFNQVGDNLRFESVNRLPLSRFLDAPAFDDGILSADHTYTVEAVYEDVASGETVTRTSRADVDCAPDIDVSRISQLGENLPFLLIGGCDNDNYLDLNETFSLSVSFFNVDPNDLVQAQIRAQACQYDPDRDVSAGECNPVSYITFREDAQELGYLPAQTLQLTRFAFTVTGTPPERDVVDIDICLSGAITGQYVEDCTTFTMLAQADDDKRFYITDCPNGCETRYDVNNDENYDEVVPRNQFDPLDLIHAGQDETVTYSALTSAPDEDTNGVNDCQQSGEGVFGPWENNFSCGNPGFNGPWNFDTDDEGFTSGRSSDSETTNPQGITNWGEDWNWNNFLDANEDKNGNFTLDQNWNKNGGCGWMSNDPTGTGPGGIWHTGTIGNWQSSHTTDECRDSDAFCEKYEVFLSDEGTSLWFEMLHTPVFHPVHFGTHPDGFDWRTQILDWSWAMQWDTKPGASWTWEFDLNVDDQELITGDTIIAGDIFGGRLGLVSGGQWDIFDGGLAFVATNVQTGHELDTNKGGDRENHRGCFFNDLLSESEGELTGADRVVNIPKPWDDDCDNEFDLGSDGCPGLCGEDDDGNGVIDDPGEICPCYTCSGGPRDGVFCVNAKTCNPDGGRTYLCLNATNSSGVPTPYGDDSCGDGNTDEGVFPGFGTDIVQSTGLGERVSRNASPELVNGVGRGGRPVGDMAFNTLEDFYGPAGDSWKAEVGFVVFEPNPGASRDPSYGLGVDNMVVEWMEVHPIGQSELDVCYQSATPPESFEGQCAVVSLGETANTFDGDTLLSVSVTDPIPDGNLIDCSGPGGEGDPDGTAEEVEVVVTSEAERSGETYCLASTDSSLNHFEGTIRTSTTVRKEGDGLLYLAFNGLDTPSITASYYDADDGIHSRNNGPDGAPGIANFDDDGDCSGPNCEQGKSCDPGTDTNCDEPDELCPTQTLLAEGRRPHEGGTPARYSDDECGCLDNPIQDATLASFDSADVIIAKVVTTDDGDGDGWADPGEEVTVDFTVRNLTDFAIEDIKLRLSTLSDKVQCLTGDTIEIDRLEPLGEAGDEVDTSTLDPSAGTFSFIAEDVSRPTGDTGSDFSSEFIVTLSGLGRATAGADGGGRRDTIENLDVGIVDVPIFGTAVTQKFTVVHNLDRTVAGSDFTWEEDFEDYTTDNDLFAAWERHNTGDQAAELDGTRCQSNDPANPFGANTDPLNYCEIGEGFSNTVNEWHLAAEQGCGSQGTGYECRASNIKSIDADDPINEGVASMWLSWQNYINASAFDGTIDYMTMYLNRMRWIETANNIQLGPDNPELSYWTQMSITDGRLFVGLDLPTAFDAARTYVCVDDNNNNACDTLETGNLDGAERWEPLSAYFNTEQSWRQNNFINCMFEPSDDGNNEDEFYEGETRIGPSSTCFPNLSDTCVGRTREDDPNAAQTGTTYVTLRSSCFPETGQVDSEVEGVYERGEGTGIWALKKYDLRQYRNRKVLLRFHVSPGGLPGFDYCAEVLTCGNLDDGWVIDDMKITGARTSDYDVTVDNTGGGGAATCPEDPCGEVFPRVAVRPQFVPSDSRLKEVPVADRRAIACTDPQLEYCDYDEDGTVDATSDVAQSDAPGRKWLLDARKSSSDSCFEGDLQYRMELPDGTLLRDWLSDAGPVVAPVYDTTYNVFVRCSSDLACEGQETVTIETGLAPEGCDPITGLAFDLPVDNKADFSWLQPTGNACPAVYDVTTGGLNDLLTSSGSFAGGSCLENDSSDTSSSDPTDPDPPGTGFWYVAAGDGETYNTGAASQQGDRDTTMPPCP